MPCLGSCFCERVAERLYLLVAQTQLEHSIRDRVRAGARNFQERRGFVIADSLVAVEIVPALEDRLLPGFVLMI